MDHRAAKRYASALFRTAVKLDMVQSVEDDLTAISGIISSNDRFRELLQSPEISRDEKLQILERLFSDRVTSLTMQAIRLLLEKRREAEIGAVQEEFVILRREHGNVIFATVTTSEPLDNQLREALVRKLESSSGRKVESEYRVDPRLVGGIRVAYGNFVLDGSIKGGLDRLRDTLKRDLLKQA